jgi:hypothetical protein
VSFASEGGDRIQAYLLAPASPPSNQRPAVVVFHETTPNTCRQPAGVAGPPDRAFGVELVRRGYIVLCPECYILKPIPNAANTGPINWAKARAAELKRRRPRWTGMGKLVFDASRCVDFLESIPEVDRSRIGCLGFSLGAKQVIHAMAFDPRYKAGVAIFFLLLGLVVGILPAGDSLGLFSILGTLLGFLLAILVFVSQLMVGLLLMLISLPFLLFGQAPPGIGNSAPPPMPVFPSAPEAVPFTSAALEFVRSFLLWGALIAIVLFSVIRFARQHESLLAALRRNRITNWLMLAWQWLYRNVDRTRESLVRAIADGWQTFVSRLEGNRMLSRPGWINVRALDPRRRVYFFYLAMIRRGNEQGIARKPAQTPAEYAVQLEQAIPSVQEDIDSMTQAFVEARYSRREVDSKKAAFVKTTWDRIRRALRGKSKERPSGTE